jgi:hypothetical protein
MMIQARLDINHAKNKQKNTHTQKNKILIIHETKGLYKSKKNGRNSYGNTYKYVNMCVDTQVKCD